jgi:serine-type D-Ala-D-Ala carboxypeptidase/endopeptidase (penicillin-binding protein 4)
VRSCSVLGRECRSARRASVSTTSVERLAAPLRRSGLRRVTGRVYGDVSLYSDNGGTPFELVLCSNPLFGRDCPYGPAGKLERPIPNGPRIPIGFNRGLRSATGAEPQRSPARFAARGLIRALRRAGVRVDGGAGAAIAPGGPAAARSGAVAADAWRPDPASVGRPPTKVSRGRA